MRTNFSKGYLVRVVLLILASTVMCSAQAGPGTLRVQVNDPSGSQVPGASVTLSGAGQTGSPTQAAKTNIQGQYLFRDIEPGVYVVRVDAKGFAKYEIQRVEVTAGRTQTLAIPLALATASDQVTVRDTA